MSTKKILSIFFLILFLVTALLIIDRLIERREQTIDVKRYQAIEQESTLNEITGRIQEELPAIEIPETTKSTQLNSIPFEISDNKNTLLLKEIKDYTGWITIDNSQIDYPVVKAKDNEFYLTHNYKREKNRAGAIFMDRRNLGNQYDEHTIIYGHNMKDGSMFKDLNKYLDEEFFHTNRIIKFEDLYATYEYEIISAYYISANDHTITFNINEETMNTFLQRSIHESNYAYNEEDRFLTLATCNYILSNGRMIVHAVLVE